MSEYNGEVIIYQTNDGLVDVQVNFHDDTVWLSANQMAELFERDEKTIRKHINNIFADGELRKENNTHFLRVDGVKQPVAFYSLDVIISVGYRVKSQRGIDFRIWASQILKEYMLKGYAANQKRLAQLGSVIRLMRRAEASLEAGQVLSVIERYSAALDLLDSYDHQNMTRPQGSSAVYVLTYDECRRFIDSMRFGDESTLFGNEKDDSFKGSIGNIYQSFAGQDVYPSLEEKAANLLYFVTKNHSFSDGNKRIAASLFLYFLDKNHALFLEGEKRISDATLVALTIMIAESRPAEKEMMISVIMNCLDA